LNLKPKPETLNPELESSMAPSKKELKRQYLQSHRPMGVFLIRNNANDKAFVGASLNLPGIINRHKFALQHGSHASKSLQSDWNELGARAFSFEIVDELTARTNPGVDYRQELELLEKLWLEKLQPYDEKGYNERKQTRAERLKKIAERRS
jgi:hypothetical protein